MLPSHTFSRSCGRGVSGSELVFQALGVVPAFSVPSGCSRDRLSPSAGAAKASAFSLSPSYSLNKTFTEQEVLRKPGWWKEWSVRERDAWGRTTGVGVLTESLSKSVLITW